MWWCPCWPRARPKFEISQPLPSALRPISVVPQSPRLAPAPPAAEAGRRVLSLIRAEDENLMDWLDAEMRRADGAHAAAAVPLGPLVAAPPAPSPPASIKRAYTPEGGSITGIVVHLGAQASDAESSSVHASSSSSSSSSSRYSTYFG